MEKFFLDKFKCVPFLGVDGKDLIYLTCLCLCIFLCLYDCLLVGTGQLKIILDRFNCVPSLSLVEWIECI